MCALWAFIVLCSTTLSQLVQPSHAVTEIFIGAILPPTDQGINDTVEGEAFKLAIDQVNANTINYTNVRLRGLIRYADPYEDFDNIDKVDELLRSNISILIGPMETSAVLATHPLCIKAHVPQIAPLTTLHPGSTETPGTNYLIRISPTEALRAKVIASIVKHYEWQTMAVLGYKDKEASIGHSRFRMIAYNHEWNVVAASLFPPHKSGRRIQPYLAFNGLDNDATRLAIVFCPAWAVNMLINQANSSKMHKKLSEDFERWTWIFSDFGNQEKDLLKSPGVVPKEMRGLLGIKPSFAKGARFQQFKQSWNSRMPHTNFTVSAGRVYDSVLVAAEGIKRALNSGIDLSKPPIYLGFCGDLEQQPENTNGKELARHINEVIVEGVMGRIQVNNSDSPGSSFFDVVNLRADGQHKVGEWNESGLQMDPNNKPVWSSGSNEKPTDIPNILRGKTLKITTILAPPFVMSTKGNVNSRANETQEFEGLCIDILEKMREKLGFNYKIYVAPDEKYGVRDRRTGKWNGVVSELMKKKADMSIAPMTISSDRQAVIDFTQPYITFGLAYVIRVKDVPSNYFRFLSPFDKSLWIVLCVLVIGMSVLIWTCSILSPWGYHGRCLQSDSIEKQNFLLHVRQGAEHPNSWSGRITVFVFWFAVMIIIATYTANLAAYLTVSRTQTPIETIFDLAQQTRIEYGILKDSQLQTFFQNTDVPSYLVMGQFMEMHKTWMPSYDAAINRTMAGDFAFISDRPILDFISRQEKYCGKLKVTGGFGNTYGYGFAFHLDSPYTALFNMELFQLQKDFVISNLIHKWTKEKVKCEMVDKLEEEKQQNQGSNVQRMTVERMLGVFILLGIGIGVGFLIMIIERVYASPNAKGKKRRQTRADHSRPDFPGYLPDEEMNQEPLNWAT